MTLIKMTYDEWIEMYKPHMEDTCLVEYDTVEGFDKNKVWTEMIGDDGSDFICSGWHFVNRLNYFVTEVPFNEGDIIEVVIWTAEEMAE